MPGKMKVGLIGCGAIGTVLAEAIRNKLIVCNELIVYDFNMAKAKNLKQAIKFPVKIVNSIEELIALKPRAIIEAASQQAVKDHLPKIAAAKINIIILSTGGLLGLNVDMSRVHVPSGAVGGLDALASAALAGIQEIVLTSRKNPKALGSDKKEEEVVYEGYAEEAARKFPREMNVAATIALTVKPAKVKVRVVSDPKVERNTHEIKVKWKFGEMFLHFENDPHPDNPHTSALAAWSAIKLLQILLRN